MTAELTHDLIHAVLVAFIAWTHRTAIMDTVTGRPKSVEPSLNMKQVDKLLKQERRRALKEAKSGRL